MIILLLSSMATVNAQNNLESAFRTFQQNRKGNAINATAIIPELSIIRQQYRLERQGDTYGKNGKPYYGEIYSLGIKVSNGMYVLRSVMEPWFEDEDYLRVNVENKYNPELFWSYQRQLNDSTYNSIELEQGKDFIYPVNSDRTLYFHEDKQSDFGLSVDTSDGKKDGYMIWAYAEPNVSDSAMTVNLQQSVLNVEIKSDSLLMTMSPSNPEKIIGGLYVTPHYERGGRIQFMLAGVAIKSGKKKWALQLFVTPKQASKASKPQKTGGTVEPTPIKQDKKKKKKK